MKKAVMLAALWPLASASPGMAQDSNFLLPIPEIERRLGQDPFVVVRMGPSRGIPGERTYQATLRYPDGTLLNVKWAPAPRAGTEFNNQPRLEIAAYELQKLFLEPAEYVVPPTVARCVPLDEYRALAGLSGRVRATFRGWEIVLVVLQYWLWNVDGGVDAKDLIDEDLFERQPAYARHSANFNLLTYLIRHRDSNKGNFLRSTDPENPRLFSVDNGISFESPGESDRGDYWETLRVRRVPRASVDRLRSVTRADLQRALGVVAQFEEDGSERVVSVPPTANLEPEVGIRRRGSVLQLGLTELEIRHLFERIQRLLRNVDDEKLATF